MSATRVSVMKNKNNAHRSHDHEKVGQHDLQQQHLEQHTLLQYKPMHAFIRLSETAQTISCKLL